MDRHHPGIIAVAGSAALTLDPGKSYVIVERDTFEQLVTELRNLRAAAKGSAARPAVTVPTPPAPARPSAGAPRSHLAAKLVEAPRVARPVLDSMTPVGGSAPLTSDASTWLDQLADSEAKVSNEAPRPPPRKSGTVRRRG